MRTNFPVFQSSTAVDGWALMCGHKDDLHLDTSVGDLGSYLPSWAETELTTENDYSNVKNALIQVLNDAGQAP